MPLAGLVRRLWCALSITLSAGWDRTGPAGLRRPFLTFCQPACGPPSRKRSGSWRFRSDRLGGVSLEELVDLGLVDAREGARGQSGEQARRGARRRPRLVGPAVGETRGSAATARFVGAVAHGAMGSLAAAEPLHVVEGHADAHRVLALL